MPYPCPPLRPPAGAGSVVARIRAATSTAVSRGRYWRIRAAVAETKGAAKLVPSKRASPCPGTAATTARPGATRSTYGPTGEDGTRSPFSSTAPTPSTPGYPAGYGTGSTPPSRCPLPIAATTTTSWACAYPTAARTSGWSTDSTRDRLITRAPRSVASRMASATPVAVPGLPDGCPSTISCSETRYGRMCVRGARPTGIPSSGAPAMTLATAVPCPTQSRCPVPVLSSRSRPRSTAPASTGWVASTPESITATVTPEPSAIPANRPASYRDWGHGTPVTCGSAAAGGPQPGWAAAGPAGSSSPHPASSPTTATARSPRTGVPRTAVTGGSYRPARPRRGLSDAAQPTFGLVG